jgi:hypothetical protein
VLVGATVLRETTGLVEASVIVGATVLEATVLRATVLGSRPKEYG